MRPKKGVKALLTKEEQFILDELKVIFKNEGKAAVEFNRRELVEHFSDINVPVVIKSLVINGYLSIEHLPKGKLLLTIL